MKRAEIATKWWVINSSLYATETSNLLLRAKASHEVEWISKVDELSDGNFAVIKWSAEDIKGDKLLSLLEVNKYEQGCIYLRAIIPAVLKLQKPFASILRVICLSVIRRNGDKTADQSRCCAARKETLWG